MHKGEEEEEEEEGEEDNNNNNNKAIYVLSLWTFRCSIDYIQRRALCLSNLGLLELGDESTATFRNARRPLPYLYGLHDVTLRNHFIFRNTAAKNSNPSIMMMMVVMMMMMMMMMIIWSLKSKSSGSVTTYLYTPQPSQRTEWPPKAS